MEQTVFVVSVERDEAVVSAERASACGQCAGKASCSTLGSWSKRLVEMRVKNPLGASVGDEVVIHVPDSLVLRAAFRLYGFPMVAFFIVGAFGWFAADWTGSAAGELWAALGGFLGVFASYALIYRSERRKPVGAAHAWITRVKAKALHIPVHS